jgi:3-(3-hydroxy-phenyl)propionate hydroxylase
MGDRPAVLPLLVLGAGPIGLTSALALRAQGLPVTVLEAAVMTACDPVAARSFIIGRHWSAGMP